MSGLRTSALITGKISLEIETGLDGVCAINEALPVSLFHTVPPITVNQSDVQISLKDNHFINCFQGENVPQKPEPAFNGESLMSIHGT